MRRLLRAGRDAAALRGGAGRVPRRGRLGGLRPGGVLRPGGGGRAAGGGRRRGGGRPAAQRRAPRRRGGLVRRRRGGGDARRRRRLRRGPVRAAPGRPLPDGGEPGGRRPVRDHGSGDLHARPGRPAAGPALPAARRPGVARPAAGTDLRRAGLRGQARRRRAALRAGALRRVHGPAPGGGRLERQWGGPAAGALPLQRDPGRVPRALPRPAATAPLRAGLPRPLGRDGGRGDGRRPGRGLPGAGGDRAPDLRERPGAALHRPTDRGRPGGAPAARGRPAA